MSAPVATRAGRIEVITGSMFSGKSEELIRRLRRTQIARQKVQIFKPLIDNRFSEDHIVSHSDMRIASQNVRNSDELVGQVAEDTEVVGIDLPLNVTMKVMETEPAIKGASVSNVGKPAKMETGLTVMVPPFVGEGEKIKVNTDSGEYIERV